jgi:inner membrane protein
MFIFGHVGFTIGTATAVNAVVIKLQHMPQKQQSGNANALAIVKIKGIKASASTFIGLDALTRFLDVRILMIGALMPDIIDKPLSFLGFGNGRSITHTLLIFLIVLLIALILYASKKITWLLAISFGMFSHLILDSMWATPQTLLWPLHGWAFPAANHKIGFGQISTWWNMLLTNPRLDVSEAIGFLIVVIFIGILFYENKFIKFVLTGKI